MNTATDWLNSSEVTAWCDRRRAEDAAEAAYVAKRAPELRIAYRNDAAKLRDALTDAMYDAQTIAAYQSGDAFDLYRRICKHVEGTLKQQSEDAAADEFWQQQDAPDLTTEYAAQLVRVVPADPNN